MYNKFDIVKHIYIIGQKQCYTLYIFAIYQLSKNTRTL